MLTKQLSGRKFSTLSSVLVDNLLAAVGTSKATPIPHSLQGFRFPDSELVLSLLAFGSNARKSASQTSDEHLDQDIYDHHT